MVFFIKLILHNILRHRLRSGLTATGIVVAIVAFGMLRTLVDAWYAGAEATSATRLVTRNAISLPYFLNQASFSCSFTTSPTITRLGGRTV
jgi:putative ABC transport system permease protein